MSRLALIDDSPDNRLLIEAMLGHLYDLDCYEDGQSGLEEMRKHPPSLLLLDISLPGMDGIRVLQTMKSEPALKGIPVIAVTAHALTEDRSHYLSLGFDDYVVKPIIDQRELLKKIARQLS